MPLPTAQSIASRHADRAASYKQRKGLQEHELVLFAAFAPEGYDGASSVEPNVEIVRIEPTPRIINKALDTAAEREGGGFEIARLQQYEVSEVSRKYLDDNLTPLYWMVLTREQFYKLADGAIFLQDAKDRKYPRYRLNGSPNLFQNGWTLYLKEER
jgi:hypothetical protein